jgi:hypothetical protein
MAKGTDFWKHNMDYKVVEISNGGQIRELGGLTDTNLIVGFNNKEILLNDGKSDQVIIIKR